MDMSNQNKIGKILLIFGILTITAFIVYDFWLKKNNVDPAPTLINTPSAVDIPTVDQKEDNYEISIEKISVRAPIILDVDANNQDKYYHALTQGVAQMLGSSRPDEKGNVVIFGHSSPYSGYLGNYGEIFASLNDLEIGDEIKISGKTLGKDYRYRIESKKIVTPDDVSSLAQTERDQLTLFTCWPIGSNKKRLVIVAPKVD